MGTGRGDGSLVIMYSSWVIIGGLVIGAMVPDGMDWFSVTLFMIDEDH